MKPLKRSKLLAANQYILMTLLAILCVTSGMVSWSVSARLYMTALRRAHAADFLQHASLCQMGSNRVLLVTPHTCRRVGNWKGQRELGDV